MEWHKGTTIIEVDSIELMGKDIIHIGKFSDFAWLVANTVVFKCKNGYYNISSDVAYIWTDKTKRW